MSGIENNSKNVPIAIALVLGAGASTGLGAAVVFFPSLVMIASRRVLGASLGFSAGVMTYVSFVEIFQKAVIAFVDGGLDQNKATIYTTICFFGGVLLMMFVNKIVSCLLGDGHTHSSHHPGPVRPIGTTSRESDSVKEDDGDDEEDPEQPRTVEIDGMEVEIEDDFEDNLPVPGAQAPQEDEGTKEDVMPEEERKRLVKMGMNTALAIALHNFPEGLATFVAAVADPTIGLVLAVAIAIHNIPEGLCVALPIYYATGSRLKAFLWALSSGASEIVAALLGWGVLAAVIDSITYGVLFGVVAGMMVIISMRELLPTAHHYDPEDTVVSYSFIAGMVLMALSLVLFLI